MYRIDGCPFVSTITKVKAHELFCNIGLRNCLINSCKWFGRTIELPEHMEQFHTFEDIDIYYSYKLAKKYDHVFYFDDKIFLLDLCPGKEGSISYSVCCFGGKRSQYEYTLEFKDTIRGNDKIVLEDLCQDICYNFNRNSLRLFSISGEMLHSIFKDRKEIKFKLTLHEI